MVIPPAGLPALASAAVPAVSWTSPAVVTVVDACALAQVACGAVRDGEPVDLISALAGTGRSNPYGAAHIVEELQQHLPRIAAATGVPLGQAEEMLWRRMVSGVPIVDLSIGDHLSPASRLLLRDDPSLPAHARGDADDAPTAALAEFLAPAVILTKDSVFTRFGLAVPVDHWVGAAHGLLRAAGFEANLHTSALVAEVAARIAWEAAAWAGRAAARHPIVASAVVALAVMVCRHQGFLDPSRWRAGAVSLKEVAAPLLERFAAASEDHALTRGRLVVVEPSGPATTEQLAARHLARARSALTPAQLREALAADGVQIPATRLKSAMGAHPAFLRLAGDRYFLGRPALPASAR
ncbi:hypothetical protein OG871_39520 (plasmid) [Kitasatospora sp. NBC_00374]|uniref:hypothetical protein n=1 Tax=Kitasatospora sp. NBC_00374 TaxID=2975964 RepID=UPI002F90B329